MMIKNDDKLLIGRDDTSYHVSLADSGLAKISYVDDVVTNVTDNITDVTDRLDNIKLEEKDINFNNYPELT